MIVVGYFKQSGEFNGKTWSNYKVFLENDQDYNQKHGVIGKSFTSVSIKSDIMEGLLSSKTMRLGAYVDSFYYDKFGKIISCSVKK